MNRQVCIVSVPSIEHPGRHRRVYHLDVECGHVTKGAPGGFGLEWTTEADAASKDLLACAPCVKREERQAVIVVQIATGAVVLIERDQVRIRCGSQNCGRVWKETELPKGHKCRCGSSRWRMDIPVSQVRRYLEGKSK